LLCILVEKEKDYSNFGQNFKDLTVLGRAGLYCASVQREQK